MNDAISAYTAGMVEGQGKTNTNSGCCNDGGFGGNGAWWIWIIFLFVIFAWGRGGWGDNNGNGGGNGGRSSCNGGDIVVVPYGYGFGGYGAGSGCGCNNGTATRADIIEGFNNNNLSRTVSGIERGVCDATYALNNTMMTGFSNQQIATLQGFNGVQQGFNGVQQGFNGVDRSLCSLGNQIQNCCCELGQQNAQTRFDMATGFCNIQNTVNNNTRDVIQNSHNDTDRVIAKLSDMESTRQQERIAELQAQVTQLKFDRSQSEQNAYLTATMTSNVAELQRTLGIPKAVPSYPVNPPFPYYGYNGGCGFNNGCNNNCGCNSGCGCNSCC